MIDENGGPPGWEKFHPFDDDKDVSCEIKQLSVAEGLSLSGLFLDGKIQGDIYGETMQGYFTEYVRNIEGIKIDGVLVKRPSDILDPAVKRSKALQDFYTTVMYEFFNMSSFTVDEVKNSDSSPDENMAEVSGEESQTENRSER